MNHSLPPLPRAPRRTALPADRVAQGRKLLQQIGWEPEQLVQIALYAQKSPAQKVAQMLRIRRHMMTLMRRRLQDENPTAAPEMIDGLIRAEIDRYYRL